MEDRMRNIIVGVVIALTISTALGEWVDFGTGVREATIRIIEQSAGGTVFEVVVPGVEVAPLRVVGIEYRRISIPGCLPATQDIGKPEVPRFNVLLAIPNGAQVSLEVLTKETRMLRLANVYPLQPLQNDDEKPPAFVFDWAFYEQDGAHPGKDAALIHTGVWRDLSVANIQVYPVQVNPSRGKVEVARRIVVRAEYGGGSYPAKVTGWMVPMYAHFINNFSALRLPGDGTDEYPRGVRYLVIAHSNYYASTGLKKLVNWVNRRGYEVKVLWRDDWKDDDTVLKAIRDEYNLHNPPLLQWVMLVGQAKHLRDAEIPVFGGPDANGDFGYTCLEGDDLYPEIGIARLSAKDAFNLDSICDKIITYQKAPPVLSNWLTKLRFVADDNAYPDSFSAIIRDIRNAQDLYDYWSPERDTIMGKFCNNSDVAQAINELGTGILLYCGHGSSQYHPIAWDEWCGRNWETSDVYDLANENMTPVVFNVTCNVGRFAWDGGECLSEAWLRKCPGGAVASLASVSKTWPPPGRAICSTLVRALCDTWTIAGAHTYAVPMFNISRVIMFMDAFLAKYWDRGDTARVHCERYAVLGEPSMPVWTGGMPESACIAGLPARVNFGEQVNLNLTVTTKSNVPVENALVCIAHEDVYQADRTDANGQVRFSFTTQRTGLMTVTVSEGHTYESQPGAQHIPILPRQYIIVCGGDRWVEGEPIPGLVKEGGWLTYNSDNGLIYAARGYKSGDFYCYDPSANEWTRLNSWPLGGEGRLPYRGSAGCYGGGYIWAVKGNNTRGFWRYSVTHNTWQQLESIPRGNSGRNPKGGTDVVYVVLNDTGYVYLLKGYKQDFMRYNTISGRWQQLPNAPDGVKPKWDRGSWLVYDGVNTLYAHKAKYHELWTFDLTTGQWDTIPLQGMPFISGITGRSKKSKDGGSAAYYNGFIYALKGGNTCQFWRYDIANNSWIELDPMPEFGSSGRVKRVRGGGNITCANGMFYAFKGGKTAEFWRYLPSSEEGQSKFLIASSGTSPSGKVDGGESPIAEGVDAYCPRFRADGGTVCYSREDQNGWLQVFMAFRNMPNSEVQLTFEPTEHETPVFDHSGTWIAMSMEDEATGYYQIAKVQANPNPGPCTVLTDGEEDAEFPEWSPDGNHIVFQRYDTLTGYIQLFRVLANGGETEQLTFEDADCEKPVYLNQNEIVFHRWPDEGYIQVCKLNLLTGQITPLTTTETDHENPSPSGNGERVAYQVIDPTGTYQIGIVSATGGDEQELTLETCYDLEEPDFSSDNLSIFCVRWLGLTSEIGVVDAISGGYLPITDGGAIRDNPDSYYETSSGTNLVVYEREEAGGTGTFGEKSKPRPKRGTGIFLALFRRKQDGGMAQGSYVLNLAQSLPNPARERVRIKYSLPEETEISLKVYNSAGQLMRTLVSGRANSGQHITVWDRKDAKGERAGAGVYFYQLETKDKRLSRKVVLTE